VAIVADHPVTERELALVGPVSSHKLGNGYCSSHEYDQ